MRDLELQLQGYGAVLDGARPQVVDVVDAFPRRMRRSFFVAIAAAVVVAIATASIAVSATRSSDSHNPRVVTPPPSAPISTPTSGLIVPTRSSAVLGIGDSVMEGAQGSLQREMPHIAVDAVKSRQFAQAVTVLNYYAQHNALPDTIVIALGTNGTTSPGVLDQMMRIAGDRDVFFVTARVPRPWETAVNELIRALPDRWPNAHVIDWHDFGNAHDDWFVADGFHLTTAGQQGYATLVAAELGLLPTPTTTVAAPSPIRVVGVIDALTAWDPLTVAGGDVWVAVKASTTSTSFVRLERRDPATSKLLGTIDVPQEAVFSIAGDGDTLWVAGGGDGGVPDTTVSRVDVRTGKVVFTKTLKGTPCSCPIVAGSAGVWLVGNSSDYALHLSKTDGHVIANIALGHGVLQSSAIEMRGRLVVGLEDGTIAVVDPTTDRIERRIPKPVVGDEVVEAVVAMSPVSIPAIGPDPAIDGLVARRTESLFAFLAGRWTPNEIAPADFLATTIAGVGSRVAVLGADRLLLLTTHAVSSAEFSYDPQNRRFDRSSGAPTSTGLGFRNAVAVGDTLWVVYDPGNAGRPSIVVIRIPPGLP